jgi:hypothetical protein
MKKSVGEKASLKNVSFQVYEACEKFSNTEDYDKLTELTNIYEKERKNFVSENLLLRQKIYLLREELVKFAEWIDQIVFRQSAPNYSNKMLINHNLLFRKESLVDEFKEILEEAKGGISQIATAHLEQHNIKMTRSVNIENQTVLKRGVSLTEEAGNNFAEMGGNMKKSMGTQRKNVSMREKMPVAKKREREPLTMREESSDRL